MKPLRCLAIDDEPMALEKLETYIRKVPFLELTAGCESPFEAMQVMTEQKVDALFIDINMPDLNGLDFIASLSNPPLVVFTTAYAEYAVDSYRLSAIDYLLKPFDFADFQRAANKLLNYSKLSTRQPAASPETHLLVKEGYKYVNIKIADILYIKGLNEYVRIFMCDHKPVVAHTAMKQIKAKLPDSFLQVHRSYIVNMKRIREIERMCIVMDESTRIAVDDNYKKDVIQYLRTHSLDRSLFSKETDGDVPKPETDGTPHSRP